MYKFVSSQDKRALHRAYNALYVQDLEEKNGTRRSALLHY